MSTSSPEKPSIGIIGGGPAGISIGKMLLDRGIAKPTVFEAKPRIGGKSYSIDVNGSILEMGTTYASLAHKITNKWMKELKIPQRQIGLQLIDGIPLKKFITAGEGPPLTVQALRYIHHQRRLSKAEKQFPIKQDVLDELAMPASDWLRKYNLPKIERLLWRAFTSIGYGYLKDIPILHVFRWCDFDLVLSALINYLYMPINGWTDFWEQVGRQLDIRLETPIDKIERSDDGVRIFSGENHYDFDYLINTIPMDDFGNMTRVTPAEHFVTESVSWHRYVMTLCAVKNWFESHYIEVFSEALTDEAEIGRVLSARIEDVSDEFGGKLYIAGQFGGPYSNTELAELAAFDVQKLGGEYLNTVQQIDWKYGPYYSSDAIRNGLLATMNGMQGQKRTFYSGATFSHEVVSKIVAFNDDLAGRIQEQIR